MKKKEQKPVNKGDSSTVPADGTVAAANKDKLCSPKTCGDCDYYKYYSLCGLGCHLTYETGIIRKGPITKDCKHKVKISKEEQRKRFRNYKMLMKGYAIG